jgi:hypothetical protein
MSVKSFHLSYDADDAKRVLFWLIAAEIILVILHIVLHTFLPHRLGHLSRIFDMDHEISVPTWFSSVQLFLCGIVLLSISRTVPLHKWFIVVSAFVIIFLSMDEGSELHETLSAAARDHDIAFLKALMIRDHGAWMIPYMIIAVLYLVLSWKPITAIYRDHRHPSLFVIGGGIIVLAGAVGMELLSYFFFRDGADLLYSLEVAAEEFMEMLGVSIILYGILIFGIDVQSRREIKQVPS